MEFVSNISKEKDIQKIIDELTLNCKDEYDMGVLFVSLYQKESIEKVIDKLKTKVKIKNFLACTCAGIIGNDTEIENQIGSSLLLANMPEVKFKPFYITQNDIEGFQTDDDYYSFFDIYPNENPMFLVIPDPFQIDLNKFILGMNTVYGTSPLVGGLASGSSTANGNFLMVNDESYNNGIIGLMMTGPIKMDTIVSQGCKPVGETYIVTKAEGSVIHEVAGKPFLEVLKKIFLDLSEEDRKLVQKALLIGIAMDEYNHDYSRGDFLVRAVLGIDQETGAIAIGDTIKAGQTIQLQIRDAKAAEDDLNKLLEKYKTNTSTTPQGAFVFSCNGRGLNLFGEPDHDIKLIQKHLGPIPAAGFFCAGEIGPIGGKNFLHGFTESIVVFS